MLSIAPATSTHVSALTRRRFLRYSGVAAGGLMAGCTSHPIALSDVTAVAESDPREPGTGVLVVVTLYGGNDGLNTVVPAGDAAYQQARPDLAYRPDEVLDLGEGLGLNPGMTGLKSLWDNKKLAVVRGVGYPEPDHSHFRSMAIWQTASPKTPTSTGWLGRWLDDVAADDPLRGVSLDPVMPPLMSGSTRSAAAFPPGGLRLPGGRLGQGLQALGDPCAQDRQWQAAAAGAIADLRTVAAALEPAVGRSAGGATANPAPEGTEQQGGSAGGGGALGVQLDLVASMIEMGSPTRAYSVSLGGFDTHSDERGTQQRLLTEVDAALAAFQKRMAADHHGNGVVTLVYSEFGRRVTANASEGTDHGTAGPMFLLGEGVNGGFFGDEPDLGALQDGDLAVTTDFRSVYATVLRDVLDVAPDRYLDGWTGTVDGVVA